MSRAPFTYFAIFGAMRTGSNLLERNLNQYENLACLGELFNPFFIGKAGQETFDGITLGDRERDPMGLINTVISANPGKLPGFRIFEGHDARIFKKALKDPNCAKIILKRKPLDSFLSLKIAQKTDQWILGNAPARKTAQVTYNGQEYRSYLSELDHYYRDLHHQIQIAGQTAFEIRYEDLKSVDIMNGLAMFLGLDEEKSAFEEPIKRQNPEPASQKVLNYDEMMRDLASLGFDGAETGNPGPQKGLGAKDLVACSTAPLLFAPNPGLDNHAAFAWMARIDGVSPKDLKSEMNQKRLGRWQERAPNFVSFSLVDHPLSYAYRVFMRRIFPESGTAYSQIRKRLVAHFDLVLPISGQTWSKEEHALAFEAFLVFLKSNLAGQTSIRIDGNWEAQHKLLATLATTQPIMQIIRKPEFAAKAGRIANSLGVSRPEEEHPVQVIPFALVDIYSKRLENLARAAYSKDYRMFGFSDFEA